jgi:hypothetical protein
MPIHSSLGDVDDRFSKSLRGFLREVVPNAARDVPVLIPAGEFVGIGAGVQVRCAVGIAFHGDGRHGDDREFGKPLFQVVVFRLAFRETKSPAIIVNDNADVVRVVEGRRAAIERGSSNCHCGEAVFQISLQNSRR